MSAILATIVGSGEDSDPQITYIKNEFVGSRSANNSYTTTVDIGLPHPNRRLIMYNISDLYPTGTVNFSCTVNGVPVTNINTTGGYADGTSITTAATVWAGSNRVWISDPIPTGTTATVVFNNSLDSWWGNIGFIRAVNLLNSGVVSTGTQSTSTITVPIGGLVLFQGESTFNINTSPQDSPSTITNTTFRFRSDVSPITGGTSPYSAFDYVNNTRTEQTLTFTPNSGLYRYYIFR